MHDLPPLLPQQRPLPFLRRDLWDQFPEETRRQCQDLCQHLLRSVLEVETPQRRTYEREDSARPA
jgi:hypothetical protein